MIGCVGSVSDNDGCDDSCVGGVCVGGCDSVLSKKLLSQHSCFSLQQILRIFSLAFFDFVFEVFFVVSSFLFADLVVCVVFGVVTIAVVTFFVDWFRSFGLVGFIWLVSVFDDGLTVGFNPFFEFFILES